MKILLCFGTLLFAAATLSAADIDISGKWSGSFAVTGPGGESQQGTAVAIFQQKGKELTGTGGDENQQFPILKGRVEGNKITFEVQSDGPRYQVDVMLEGDHIKGDVTVVEGAQTSKGKLDLTRVK